MIKKSENVLKEKNAFKGYASSYNVEILNSFYPKLQLKDTESAIKNKLRKSLPESKRFEFVTTIVLMYKRI